MLELLFVVVKGSGQLASVCRCIELEEETQLDPVQSSRYATNNTAYR